MILTGAKICAENAIHSDGAVEIAAGKITQILSAAKIKNHKFSTAAKVCYLPKNWTVFPGMIDLHIHGAYGIDAMHADNKALADMSKKLAREGVTAYVATTMTEASDEIDAALKNIKNYRQQQERGEGAELLGVNLEGPFIAKDKSCAQPKEHILSPNLDLLKVWHKTASNGLRLITIAPEIKGSDELIDYAVKNNIVAAVGHSNASYTETCAAIKAGCNHATHLFNGMAPLHHRQPGNVAALLLNDNVYVELIADGVHLHPAILQMVLRLKGADKIILITDSIAAKGLGDGDYKLAGQDVRVADGRAVMANNVLAGSVLTMDQALRNMLQFSGCSLLDVSKMVAQNPARQLGIAAHKGSIAVGKDADIVVLDENYRVMLTLCCGKVNFVADNQSVKDVQNLMNANV